MDFKYTEGEKIWYRVGIDGKFIIKAIIVKTYIDLFDIPRYTLKITSKVGYPYRRGAIISVSDKHIAKRD